MRLPITPSKNCMPFFRASVWIASPDRSSNTPTWAWLCWDIGWLLLKGVRLSREIAIGLSPGTNAVGIGVALDFDAKTRTVQITKVPVRDVKQRALRLTVLQVLRAEAKVGRDTIVRQFAAAGCTSK